MIITIQRIHFLLNFVVIFSLKMVTYLYMLTFFVQKCLELEQNLNTLNNYDLCEL